MDPRIAYYNSQFIAHQLPSTIKLTYNQLYQKNSNFAAVKFISECCTKLDGK